MYSTETICLVDHVDLICRGTADYFWEGFGSSSLVTLSLGFNCDFVPSSRYGSSIGFAPEAVLEDLGLPL